jgi:hypothetical protein
MKKKYIFGYFHDQMTSFGFKTHFPYKLMVPFQCDLQRYYALTKDFELTTQGGAKDITYVVQYYKNLMNLIDVIHMLSSYDEDHSHILISTLKDKSKIYSYYIASTLSPESEHVGLFNEGRDMLFISCLCIAYQAWNVLEPKNEEIFDIELLDKWNQFAYRKIYGALKRKNRECQIYLYRIAGLPRIGNMTESC